MDAMSQDITANILLDYSLEATPKDLPSLEQARHLIPQGTMISVPYLPAETLEARVATAAAVRRLGFVPVPHISARRLSSADELGHFLDRLAQEAAIDSAFVIAGDADEPLGPYADALAVIRSGILQQYGVRHVGVAGYPEGHPQIDDARLWQALHDKRAVLEAAGLTWEIFTQFAFDSAPIVDWLARLRREGISVPVRLGVPGPASVKTLLRFAARCGVAASSKVLLKYGISLTKLLNTAGPDRLVNDLSRQLSPAAHGAVHAHFFPFGGVPQSVQWVRDYLAARR